MMTMGNIVLKVGIKPTSLTFQANVRTGHHLGSLMLPSYPHLPVYVAPHLTGQCRLLHSFPFNCKTFNAYNYIHTCSDITYTHTQGGFNDHIAHCLYRILLMVTNVVGVMKMGKYCD